MLNQEIQIRPEAVTPEIAKKLLRTMELIRRFEEKIVSVYSAQDMKTPVHLYIGQEAIASAFCAHLNRDDYLFTTHRSHGHMVAKGFDPKILYAEFYGRIDGCCKGKGGSMHPVNPELGVLGTSAIVGAGIALGAGTALKSLLTKDGRVTATFFGDGAVEEGAFHESLNFAALKKLPVVFVCENNFYATNSYLTARQAHDQIYKYAGSYDIPGFQADGNDVLDVYAKAQWAIERARKGDGPTLIECRTYRWKGHVGPEVDHEKGCRPKQELEDWQKKCPIASFKKHVFDAGLVSESDYESMTNEIDSLLDEALNSAKQSPFPTTDELLRDVYYERT